MSESTIILGIGTGRCGTKSLSHLLSRCRGAVVTHEASPSLPWSPTPKSVAEAWEYLTRSWQAPLWHGDVAYRWGPHVEPMLELAQDAGLDLRVIGLIRDRESCAESMMKVFGMVGQGHTYISHPKVGGFPTLAIDDPLESYRAYWQVYADLIADLCERYPERVTMVRTEDLDNINEQRRLFQHCGIPADRWGFEGAAHYHTREEVKASKQVTGATVFVAPTEAERLGSPEPAPAGQQAPSSPLTQ